MTTTPPQTRPSSLAEVAERLAGARRLLIGTGAGMSADSGIATYRRVGETGWQAYGKTSGVDAADLMTPRAFEEEPARAWGFLEVRRRDCAAAAPHAGYAALHAIAARAPEAFVQTTNVDGLHVRAGWTGGFHEIHGSIWRLQCVGPCSRSYWPDEQVPWCELDPDGLARDWPRCPACGRTARPHAILFADLEYTGNLAPEAARRAFHQAGPDVVLVVGESGAIPTHAHDAQTLRRERGACWIEINPDPGARGAKLADLYLPLGAKEALVGLATLL